jgi:hypothetical protein
MREESRGKVVTTNRQSCEPHQSRSCKLGTSLGKGQGYRSRGAQYSSNVTEFALMNLCIVVGEEPMRCSSPGCRPVLLAGYYTSRGSGVWSYALMGSVM